MEKNRKVIYPQEAWSVTETAFLEGNNYRNETTFALSNGYIGTRGTFEEAYPFDIDTGLEGNFINGFYESEKIRYGEANFGSPVWSQSLLNLPNLKETRIVLGGEMFDMRTGMIEDYERKLHMRDAVLSRSLVWTSPEGKRAKLEFERLVSFANKNIMGIRICVTPLNFSGKVKFCSKLNADVENHTRKTNPIVDYGPFGRRIETEKIRAEGNLIYYQGTTRNSRLTVGCGSIQSLWITRKNDSIKKEWKGEETDLFHGKVWTEIECKEGQSCCVEKFICYTSSRDMEQNNLEEFVLSSLKETAAQGYGSLRKKQQTYMHQFWENADIKIEGQDALLQGIRFNLFHVMQSAGRDGRTGMGAKGLSGEGYEGHYFWDTEMYVLPFLIYTEPETARSLLEYRYRTLDQARERARVLGHMQGALYPWRTINGEEASTYYPLGTAQYHINADIAYALSLYLQVTKDVDFFLEMGAEMLIETARIWADVGSFAACRGGKYCICDVTGPDEYNVLVDNNFYTNLMAREHLRDADRAVKYLQEKAPAYFEKLKEKIDFREQEEPKLWGKIIENMYFPYDESRQIYPMDDGFMMRKPWDENRIPPEKRAWLYENYHPLFIMRHRMSKQADAILGMYLHSQYFREEEIRRNYDFYQEMTLHHSSLSTCIFGIVACSIGYYEEAYRYFEQSARMDLDDCHNNFYAGIHAANMAGTWQTIVNGFAGLRCYDNAMHFSPYLPKQWKSCTFRLNFGGNLLEICMHPDRTKFALLRGEGLAFFVNKREVILQAGGNYEEEI